mmetsp:Transcript_25478/g.73299  ORF Transcript_25478/g.73299 Transcript_25478/m.73299 type:complete len:487 (-) Transcript_25478:409-1869(-)
MTSAAKLSRPKPQIKSMVEVGHDAERERQGHARSEGNPTGTIATARRRITTSLLEVGQRRRSLQLLWRHELHGPWQLRRRQRRECRKRLERRERRQRRERRRQGLEQGPHGGELRLGDEEVVVLGPVRLGAAGILRHGLLGPRDSRIRECQLRPPPGRCDLAAELLLRLPLGPVGSPRHLKFGLLVERFDRSVQLVALVALLQETRDLLRELLQVGTRLVVDRRALRCATPNAVGTESRRAALAEVDAREQRPHHEGFQGRHALGVLELGRRCPKQLVRMSDPGALEPLEDASLAFRVDDVRLGTAVRALAVHRVLPTCPVHARVDHLRAVLVVAEPADAEHIPIFGDEGPEILPIVEEVRRNLHVVFGDEHQVFGVVRDASDGVVVADRATSGGPLASHVRVRRLAEALLLPIHVGPASHRLVSADGGQPIPLKAQALARPRRAQRVQLMVHVRPALRVPVQVDVLDPGNVRCPAGGGSWPRLVT